MSERGLSWDWLRAYKAVSETGSLSGGARRLGLSHPTIRRQIELLEAAVGTPLFTRAPSGLIATEGSEALMEQVRGMEAAAGSFARFASGPSDGVVGRVRLTAPAVFAAEMLPPVLASIREEHPKVDFELSVTNLIENLLRRDADLAVRLAPPAQQGLVARKVAPVVFGLFARPGTLADLAASLPLSELAGSGLLIVQDREDTIEAAFRGAGVDVPIRAALRTDDDLVQLAAIREGLGVGVTQLAIAARYGLQSIHPEFTVRSEVWITMHEDQRSLRRVRIVFDALVAALRGR